MALKHYNPTTPSQRQLVTVDRADLWKGKPVKKLTRGMVKSGGRNNTGRVTMWHRGGGHKRRYRVVDFHRKKFDIPAVVERLEYDPNRTAFIALINYEDGEQSYIIAPQRLNVGDRVVARVGVCAPVLATLAKTRRHSSSVQWLWPSRWQQFRSRAALPKARAPNPTRWRHRLLHRC